MEAERRDREDLDLLALGEPGVQLDDLLCLVLADQSSPRLASATRGEAGHGQVVTSSRRTSVSVANTAPRNRPRASLPALLVILWPVGVLAGHPALRHPGTHEGSIWGRAADVPYNAGIDCRPARYR
ncbi:MAG: hypothetical protein H0X18_12065 [Geodermatophilaceae bacterium]|nr:hypothetical protein [Geodermatophilaceae bacterium]